MTPLPPVEVLYVECEARNRCGCLERARALYPSARLEEFDDLDALRRRSGVALTSPEAKKRLILAINRGPFVRPFPTGRSCLGSREHYLLHGVGCFLDCDYCFVCGYASCHVPTCFVNTDDMADEVRVLAAGGDKFYIHAGELADPGLFEPITGAARALDDVLLNSPSVIVEYRTKWDDVSAFMDLRSKKNIVLAWTLTPGETAEEFEHGAPPTSKRIKAAARAAQAGFTIGVRFDPIIYFPNWREAYEVLVNNVFENVPAESIDRVVLGVLRFSAATESRLREKIGPSRLLAGEFILDGEGKRRYPRFQRVALYRHISALVRKKAPALPVELSMETDEVTRIFHKVCPVRR